MAIPQISKRMSALPAMPTEHDDQNPDTVQDIQDNVNGVAAEWVIGVDSLRRTNAPAGYIEGSDGGTQFIPMSRIAMRDTHGKIPANMLPSYIDDMMFGSMIFADNKATFIETYFDPNTQTTQTRTYVSPDDHTHPVPSANIIFIDSQDSPSPAHTATNLQYRYFPDQASTGDHYGFVEVPGSRAVGAGYGIIVTTPDPDTAELTVKAKKPKRYIGKGSGNAFTISQTATGLGTLSDIYTERLTINSVSTKFTVDGLCSGGDLGTNETLGYHMDIELDCYPETKDAYMTKVTLLDSHNLRLSASDYDMSSNATSSETDTVVLSCDFSTDNVREDFTIVGESGHNIKAKVNRVTVTELL